MRPKSRDSMRRDCASELLRKLRIVVSRCANLCMCTTTSFEVRTNGKGTYEITDQVRDRLRREQNTERPSSVFVQHTSCSLVIMENADPTARKDLEEFFERLVPEDTDY